MAPVAGGGLASRGTTATMLQIRRGSGIGFARKLDGVPPAFSGELPLRKHNFNLSLNSKELAEK